jgi:hypothetical protein
MKTILATLLLLSLALTGCVVEPGGGYRDHGYENGGHADVHAGFNERN